MGGYRNRILRVDLSNGAFSEEVLSDELIHDYIGGRGFGSKLLYDGLKAGVDPMSPDNEIIYMAGPLAGTNAQSFARWKIYFKSPLTGTIFKSSGGGHFASELKFAGFDGVIIKGVAEKPVYIWINDGNYELRDATFLWGLDCDDTHAFIREELKDQRIRITCIGPAGEHGVRFAGVYEETVSTVKAVDISGLVKILQDMHGPDFAREVKAIKGLRILVNGREYQLLAGMGTLLKDKDSVVLLPPIEGG